MTQLPVFNEKIELGLRFGQKDVFRFFANNVA